MLFCTDISRSRCINNITKFSSSEAKNNYKMMWRGVDGNQTDTNLPTKNTGEEGNSVLKVNSINEDAVVTCSIGQASATIVIDMYGTYIMF